MNEVLIAWIVVFGVIGAVVWVIKTIAERSGAERSLIEWFRYAALASWIATVMSATQFL